MALFITLFSTGLYAESSGNWRITGYSLEHGLSQIYVSSIIQDSYGFLWIGTQDGLNRFDGYEFVVYRHQPTDANSLSGSNIRSVIEDSDGNIWAGTRDGLNKFDRSENVFSVYRHDPGNDASISSNNVFNVFQDRQGTIWIFTDQGVDRLDPETGIFTPFHHYTGGSAYGGGNGGFVIYEDEYNGLWFGSDDGLLYYDRENENYVRYRHDPADNRSLSNNQVRSVYRTSGGYILVGTAEGLNVYDKDNGSFQSFHLNTDSPARSRVNHINTISENSGGMVLVGTDGGLFSFSPGEGVFSPYGHESNSEFSDVVISDLITDHSGNLWVGTMGGLYMVDTKTKFSTYRIHDYMPDSPRSAAFVASIHTMNDDEIWIGTWGAGLYMLDRSTGGIKHYSAGSPRRERRISNDFVHVIFADSQGRIILGTRGGLDVFMGEGTGFIPFCPLPGNTGCTLFYSNRVYSIYEDSRQTIWVGTAKGLHSFRGDSLESYYNDPSDSTSIASSQVHDILECREGNIWIATADGLSRYNTETGKFRNYLKISQMGRFSLSNNELTCLHEDSAGNLWIGSVSGLNRFFRTTGSFIVFSEMEGLPNNLIYSILEDDSGKLWMSTNRGLARFDPATLDITNYDVADGLQSYEFNLGASHKSDNGELFFGGVEGLNAFFPGMIEKNNNVPPVVATSLEISGPHGITQINVSHQDEITLEHYQNSISIEFAALDYTKPEKNRYSYMLERLDNNWIDSRNRRVANYSRIPPGSYIFRVKGSNNDGVWNEEGFSLRITVLAPWWQSVYAWIMYALFFGLLVYLTVLYSTRRLRNANLILREKEMASAEISRQKEELSIKNKNITDSISYARRIQIAMMPKAGYFRHLFPDSFVYYKPKDIVSGDFYWVNKIRDKIYFAVIDCTGHGVPGAFMSVIGNELLRNIINIKGVEKPSEILNMLNEDFSNIFSPGGDKDFSFRDGMDIGFCVIDMNNARLEFAGAFSPMYLVRNNKIIEIKGNRFSVGLMEDLIEDKFDNHFMQLQKNDMIYLFSDGYPDQFGGEEGKKFKFRRFRHLLLNIHNLPATRQEELLHQSIVKWMGNHEQVDDILIMGVRPMIGPDIQEE